MMKYPVHNVCMAVFFFPEDNFECATIFAISVFRFWRKFLKTDKSKLLNLHSLRFIFINMSAVLGGQHYSTILSNVKSRVQIWMWLLSFFFSSEEFRGILEEGNIGWGSRKGCGKVVFRGGGALWVVWMDTRWAWKGDFRRSRGYCHPIVSDAFKQPMTHHLDIVFLQFQLSCRLWSGVTWDSSPPPSLSSRITQAVAGG